MKPFFTTEFTSLKSKKIPLGSRCRVDVPKDYKNSHGTFKDAIVEIVSKKDFKDKHQGIDVPINKVVCKILKAPNANRKYKSIVGLSYPIRRSWLTINKHKCICDTKDVLMITGCKCGGC